MEYNDEILHRLQQLELGILDDFIRVCRENSLTWWAFSGTGIGALRHQGFIPWDDDIDVCLPRADYNRLIAVFKEQLADKYIVVNADEFPSFPLQTTRITLRDSIFEEASLQKAAKSCPFGIFLDVYAFDNVAQDPAAAKRQAWKTWILGKLMVLSSVPFPYLPFKGVKAKLVHAATAVGWAVMRLFRVSPGKIYQRVKKASTRYNGQPTTAYAYFNEFNPFQIIYSFDVLFPLRQLPFEGRMVNFPNKLEQTLESLYGDFMQLPPPEKRKNHFPSRLKFPGEDRIYTDADSAS